MSTNKQLSEDVLLKRFKDLKDEIKKGKLITVHLHPIKKITDRFAEHNKYLKEIHIPSSVTSIGYSSFSGCSSLKQITVPSSELKFGNAFFLNAHH